MIKRAQSPCGETEVQTGGDQSEVPQLLSLDLRFLIPSSKYLEGRALKGFGALKLGGALPRKPAGHTGSATQGGTFSMKHTALSLAKTPIRVSAVELVMLNPAQTVPTQARKRWRHEPDCQCVTLNKNEMQSGLVQCTFWSQVAWVPVLALLLTSCINLKNYLTEPQFSHL